MDYWISGNSFVGFLIENKVGCLDESGKLRRSEFKFAAFIHSECDSIKTDH
jgi:hypothetical protein